MPDIRLIPVDLIDPHPHNPRRDLGDLTKLRRLLAAAVSALPALLDAAEESDALRAERGALAAMLSGRCLSDITHRDEEHRQSVCMLPEGHAPLAHDDCMGCTWTDAEHWEPSVIDVRSAAVERVRALHRPVGRHNFCGTCAYAPWPCATYRALDGEADRDEPCCEERMPAYEAAARSLWPVFASLPDLSRAPYLDRAKAAVDAALAEL